MTEHDDAQDLANRYINGNDARREDLIALPKKLAASPTFALGLRVYDKLRDDDLIHVSEREKIAQAAILCAYKDPDVPLRQGLDRAIEIFATECDLERTDDPETLGLAGAVWKRRWECTGRPAELGRSLHYYRISFMGRGPDDVPSVRILEDQGYNAINAAFVADVRAGTLELSGEVEAAADHRAEADRIRELVADALKGRPLAEVDESQRYWYGATQLEAHFGRGEFAEATAKLEELERLPDLADEAARERSSWMLQSTATQLAKIVRLRFRDGDGDALEVIRRLLGKDAPIEAVRSLVLGKVGLALSGGGFRAALYHIGVLARLAEVDALRHVEVISTVSGGTIVGAHYYLLLKNALEEKPSLSRDDYVEIVRGLECAFLSGVQTDVRSTLYDGLPADLAGLLDPTEAVGERLGRLYEEVFYAPALLAGGTTPGDRIYMDELRINPIGEDAFDFKHGNWSRYSKVPALMINATTQNTGHVWQITTSYAGESPYAIDTDVDTNDRLRRFYYRPHGDDARDPLHTRRITLGDAVAASSCVPGLFPPTDLGERYDGYRVRLVDGGVHDNQGIVSLLEQDCTQLIISDACGQMTTIAYPEGVAVGPLARSNSIMMERIRQGEYSRIDALRESGRLDGLLFVHLRQGLAGEAAEWCDSEDPRRPPIRTETLGYGVRREYQEALAAIRTDLDAFSDVEAYALMQSGYCVVEQYFEAALPDMASLAPQNGSSPGWSFQAVHGLMTEHPKTDPRHARFHELLHAGSEQFFRDAEREEQALRDYATRSVRRVVGRVALGALALVALTLAVGVVRGQLAGLWTALGLLAACVLVGAGAAWRNWSRIQTTARSAGLEDPRTVIPAVGYAAILWIVKRFSRFHLENYKDAVLAKGTVASLGGSGRAASGP